MVVSTPELVSGGTYTVTAGEQTEEVTLTGMATNPTGYGGREAGGQGGLMALEMVTQEMTPPDGAGPGGQPPAGDQGEEPGQLPDAS